jgi:hypothetical protein
MNSTANTPSCGLARICLGKWDEEVRLELMRDKSIRALQERLAKSDAHAQAIELAAG